MVPSRVTAALVVLVALVLTACSAPGRPSVGPGLPSPDGPAVVLPTDPTIPVLDVRWVQQFEGVWEYEHRAVVLADGVVLRSGDNGWERVERGRPWLQDLLDEAARDGLLTADADLGDLIVTDSPWVDLTYLPGPGAVELSFDAPGFTEGLTEEQATRRARMAALVEGLTTDGPGTPTEPPGLVVHVDAAEPDSGPGVAWSGQAVLAADSCHVLTGDDQHLLSELLDDAGEPHHLGRRDLVVAGDTGPVRLLVRAWFPHDRGCS